MVNTGTSSLTSSKVMITDTIYSKKYSFACKFSRNNMLNYNVRSLVSNIPLLILQLPIKCTKALNCNLENIWSAEQKSLFYY